MPRMVVWTDVFRGEFTIIAARRVSVQGDWVHLDGRIYNRGFVHHYDESVVNEIVAYAKELRKAQDKWQGEIYSALHKLNKPT